METYRIFLKNNYAIGILIIISALSALLAVKNIKISPDSITYSLVSQQILAGNGIRVPMIWFDSKAIPSDGTVPMLMHPPLLPVFLAIFGGVTPQSFLAAQMLNVTCHVAISVFSFLLMKNLYQGKGIALLTGILVSFSLPLLIATHHIWSETLFIALTVAAVYFLIISRHSSYKRNLFLASICTSAAILTRHAGIVILVLFFWEIFNLIKNKSLRTKYISAILATIIPIITFTVLLARNYMISGLMRRWVQPPIERSFLSAFTGTVEMIFLQFQLDRRAITLIIIFMMLFILYVLINVNVRRELSKFFYSGLDSLVIFIIIYIALISYSLATELERFELRFMYPLVPFLFIISIFIVVFFWKTINLGKFSKLSVVGLILSLSIIAFGNGYKTFLNLPAFFYKQDKIYSFQQSYTYNWVLKNYNKKTIIVSNEPYYLSFFGRYSTVILPHKRWVKTMEIPEDMEAVLPNRMSEIGATVIALFEKVEKEDFGSYVAMLFNERRDYDRFKLVYECPDGVVYELKE